MWTWRRNSIMSFLCLFLLVLFNTTHRSMFPTSLARPGSITSKTSKGVCHDKQTKQDKRALFIVAKESDPLRTTAGKLGNSRQGMPAIIPACGLALCMRKDQHRRFSLYRGQQLAGGRRCDASRADGFAPGYQGGVSRRSLWGVVSRPSARRDY